MALRAKKATATTKRLKLFMFGPAGVGKTTAAVQFPNAYIIDSERGTENYDKLLNESGSVVYQSSDINEVIQEVKSLLTERHTYRTLIIDPITTIYNDLLEKAENKVGSDFGRHYGEANKTMKRLANLIMALDMNVVVTAHAKAEYGQNLAKIGYTFDGWKQLDYWFDLVVELTKKGKKRFARVAKTRLEQFPDEDTFEWSYDAIEKRYDPSILGRVADPIIPATPHQIREIKDLLALVRLPEGTSEKWFAKAGVDTWEDMPGDAIAKCIQYVRNRLPGAPAADAPPVRPADEVTPPLDAPIDQPDAVPDADGPIDITAEMLGRMDADGFKQAVRGVTPEHIRKAEFEGGLFKFAHAKGKAVDKLTADERLELFRAVEVGALDFKSGQVREAAGV